MSKKRNSKREKIEQAVRKFSDKVYGTMIKLDGADGNKFKKSQEYSDKIGDKYFNSNKYVKSFLCLLFLFIFLVVVPTSLFLLFF